MGWNVLHVYYFEDNKDHLLIHAIRPVVEMLRSTFEVPRIFFKRHWKLGPHIALYVECEENKFFTECLPPMHDLLSTYLKKYPSTHVLDEEKYITQSESLGAWELESGPYKPLCPDNSIQIQEYKPKVELLNAKSTIKIIESFNNDSVDVIFGVLERTTNDKVKRYELIIKMMAVIAELFPGADIIKGHMSYRSHVEAYIKTFDKNGKLLDWFNNWQNKIGMEEIDRWLKDVIDFTDSQGIYHGDDSLLQEWSMVLEKMRKLTLPLAKKGEIHSDISHYKKLAGNIGEKALQRWGKDPEKLEKSEFHLLLNSSKSAERFLDSPEFTTYRILVNSFYALLPLLGINPHEKHLLCYLLANSVERVKGFSWHSFLASKN